MLYILFVLNPKMPSYAKINLNSKEEKGQLYTKRFKNHYYSFYTKKDCKALSNFLQFFICDSIFGLLH